MENKNIAIKKIHRSLGIDDNSVYEDKANAYDKLISSLRNYFSLEELEDFASWISPDDEDFEELENLL